MWLYRCMTSWSLSHASSLVHFYVLWLTFSHPYSLFLCNPTCFMILTLFYVHSTSQHVALSWVWPWISNSYSQWTEIYIQPIYHMTLFGVFHWPEQPACLSATFKPCSAFKTPLQCLFLQWTVFEVQCAVINPLLCSITSSVNLSILKLNWQTICVSTSLGYKVFKKTAILCSRYWYPQHEALCLPFGKWLKMFVQLS